MTQEEIRYKSSFSVFLNVACASLGALWFGYSISVLSLASDTILKVFEVSKDKESTIKALLTASIPFGAMIGSLLSGKVLDLFSRKNAFVVTDVIGIVATCLTQVTNIWVLLISRLISGVVTGLNSSLVPQYIQEVSPVQLGGKMGIFFSITVNFGIIVGSFLGLFFNQNPTSDNQYWRFVFLFPLIMCVARQLLLNLFYNKETPLYYALNKRNDQCEERMKEIYKEQYLDEELKKIQTQAEKIMQSSESYIDMVKPRYQKKVLIGCALQIFQQLAGINAVIMYSGEIFEKAGLDFNTKNLVSLSSNTVLMFAAILSSFFVNSLGRKTILIGGSALSGLFQLILAFLSYIDKSSLQSLSVTLIFAYYVAFNFSLGPIVWLYNSEILPEKGISIATASNWIGGTLVTLVLPYFDSFWPLFGFFAAICFICMAFTWIVVIETKGKSKLEIQNMYIPEGQNTTISDDTKNDSSLNNIQSSVNTAMECELKAKQF